MAIEARNRPLPDWFNRIRTRQTVLPRFQRFEAWSHGNVSLLFNTILRGLPVGAVLVLEVNHENQPFVWRALRGAPLDGERITEHLLDGQQRLTALWRGLHNNYDDRTYYLYLEPDKDTGMSYYVDSIGRWKKTGDSAYRPFWANDPKELWKRRMVPLDVCTPDEHAHKKPLGWLKEAVEDEDERFTIFDQVSLILQQFITFNLPFLSLPVTTEKETALDVFIKMNTSAEPLSKYDIVVAQVEATMGKSLHDLVADCRNNCPAIADYYPPEELALYASALIQGRPPTSATYLSKEFGSRLLERWGAFLRGVNGAVDFLEQERVFDSARLPTDVVLPVLVALWAMAPDGLDAEGRARNVLRKYFWRACFTGRYEKATNSRTLVDVNELKPLVAGEDAPLPTVFDDAQFRLPEPQELTAAGWPVRKDRLARAILALALKQGGVDLADGGVATKGSLAKREYHHLFPVAHLKKDELPDSEIYRSLNCALVTWTTNRSIAAKEPERYLAERRDGSGLGDTEIRARLATHLIPFDELVAGNYSAFLERRSEMIHDVMQTLCKAGGTGHAA